MTSGVPKAQPGGERRRIAVAPARVGLHVGVGALRGDGLHGLVTVSQSLGMWTRVVVTAEAETGTTTPGFSGPGTEVLAGRRETGTTLVERAVAAAFAAAHRPPEPARIEVRTQIPVAAGLGSGAADAAAALVAADELFGLGLGAEGRAGIARSLGGDVPLALHGGTVLGLGHGEYLTPMPFRGEPLDWVVAMARDGLDAEETYGELDARRERGAAPASASFDVEGRPVDDGHIDLARALAGGDRREIAAHLSNELAGAAVALRPGLRRTLEDGREAGALAGLVAGSGPTCLFLCADEAAALDVATELATRGSAHAARAVVGPVPGAHVVGY